MMSFAVLFLLSFLVQSSSAEEPHRQPRNHTFSFHFSWIFHLPSHRIRYSPRIRQSFPSLLLSKMLTFGQWINNKETPSLDAATIDVENPTDNSVVGKVPAGCAADVEAALTSAKKAQVAWAKVPVGTRAKVLKGFAAVIRECREDLIETLIAEQSKVAGLATVEIGAFSLFAFVFVSCAWLVRYT